MNIISSICFGFVLYGFQEINPLTEAGLYIHFISLAKLKIICEFIYFLQLYVNFIYKLKLYLTNTTLFF